MNLPASCAPDRQPHLPPHWPRPGDPVPQAPLVPAGAVLVVEDDPRTRKFIRLTLQKTGFRVLEAGDGGEALELFERHAPGVVLLDIGLPDMSGFDLCLAMRRQQENLAILMITGRSEDSDKVAGLELGADDYLVKPFAPEVLVARIKAVLRRCTPPRRTGNELLLGDLRLDPLAMKVFKGGHEVDLTPKEFALLAVLLRHPGEVLTRERLCQEVWGENHHGSAKALDVFICKLREKLEDDPAHPRHIRTERGVGFVCR